MAGIAFGMLIVGLLIGFAVFFAFNKYRTKAGNDGMAIKFVNESTDS